MTDKLLQDLQSALGPAFQIDRELTGGGMSRVFVASERALGRGVVIKVLPPELAAGINHERFRREVQLAAQLSHPYIVPLLHAGESGELLWFTMPYIAGESLRTRLTDEGPFPVEEVLRLLRDVVEALAYAHSRGVIHRDIKPANILSDGDHALITDFGVAKALGASLPLTGVAGHTTSGMAIGTPAYMAPEQLAADPSADHRVDLYAVGLVAYELLTGASPFAAPSPTATMTAQLTRVPRSLNELRDDVPPALANLVNRLLAKQPDDRPGDARAVLDELNRISGELVAVAHRGPGQPAAAPAPASQWPLLLSALAVMALIAVGVRMASRGGNVPAAAPETVMMPSLGDSANVATLPDQRPLTRDDSLAIAAALRDELARIDPAAARRAPTATAERNFEFTVDDVEDAEVVVVSLESQLSSVDSLVRLRLRELTARQGSSVPMVTPPRVPGAPTMGAAPGSSTPKSVMIRAAGTRGGTAMRELEAQVVRDLSRVIDRSDEWELVPATEPDVPLQAGDLPAEVVVSVMAGEQGSDSAAVRVTIRNLTPGSQFGFNMISSQAFPLADKGHAYRPTVSQVLTMLAELRRLDRGQAWRRDLGGPQSPRP